MYKALLITFDWHCSIVLIIIVRLIFDLTDAQLIENCLSHSHDKLYYFHDLGLLGDLLQYKVRTKKRRSNKCTSLEIQLFAGISRAVAGKERW